MSSAITTGSQSSERRTLLSRLGMRLASLLAAAALIVGLAAVIQPSAGNTAYADTSGSYVQIGECTGQSTCAPWAANYYNSFSCMIYTAKEIGQAGWIDSIGFNFFASDTTLSYNYLRIYVGTIDDTGVVTNVSVPSNVKMVCESTDGTLDTSTGGWQYFDSTNPFYYDGTKNLIVFAVGDFEEITTGCPKVASTRYTSDYLCAYLRTDTHDTYTTLSAGKTVKDLNDSFDRPDIKLGMYACNHQLTHYEAVPRTCTADGTVEYWQCETCGTRFSDSAGTNVLTSIVEPAGHDYVHGKCTMCQDIIAWDGETIDTDWAGSGTEADPYLITTGAELAGLSQNVAAGTTYQGVYFEMPYDINLGDHPFTPIGASDSCFFRGNFDGCGSTISGLNVETDGCAGLFGAIKSATIENLIVKGAVSTSGYTGYAGGVVGYAYTDNTLSNLGNEATVEGQRHVGGIVGYAYGCESKITITNCYNKGALTADYGYVGGIVGHAYGGSTSGSEKVILTGCYNLGTITNTAPGNNLYIGGIAGYGACAWFINCYNAGACITASDSSPYYPGGIVGGFSTKLGIGPTNCWFLQKVYYTGSTCYDGAAIGGGTTSPKVTPFTALEGLLSDKIDNTTYVDGQIFSVSVDGNKNAIEIPALNWEILGASRTVYFEGSNVTSNFGLTTKVARTKNLTFTLTPDAGYSIDSVKVGKTELEANPSGEYTIETIMNDTVVTITTHKHDLTYTDNGNGTHTATCSTCDYSATEDCAFSDYVSDNNATCTEDGTKTATCSLCGGKDTVKDEGSATGHSYGEPSFLFQENGKAASVKWSCAKCDHYEADLCTITCEITKQPTCTKMGETTYTATVAERTDSTGAVLPGASATKTVADIAAKGHSFGSPSFTFSSDGKSAVAQWSCTACSVFVNSPATVTSEVTKPATCTEMGETTYKATVAEGTTPSTGSVLPAGSATKTVTDIAAKGHSYGDWAITTMATPTAKGICTRTCSVCGDQTTKELDATGWVTFEGDAYYLTADSLATTGWEKVDDTWYFFDDEGKMVTGWTHGGYADGRWYYMNSDGSMATDKWIGSGSTWYYVQSNGVMAASKWLKVNGSWYWFKSNGRMATGWNRCGTTASWYYLGASGKMVTGWTHGGYADGRWYYMLSSGRMASATTLSINGKSYTFAKDGRLQ